MGLSVEQTAGLQVIDAAAWNRLTDGTNPFVRYEYLCGLEKHDCLTDHGWSPCHLLVYADDILTGALPLYLKTNSYGEFVFDWAWADAFERAGGQYYPKLVSAIPFAPVIGPRLLVREDCVCKAEVRQLLLSRLLDLIRDGGLSSGHCLFTEPQELECFSGAGFMSRLTCQFHWLNNGYRDFQDFLDSLVSKKRKQIKRERKQVVDQGIEIEVLVGTQICEEHWQAFYRFYCATFHRHWGNPRLTPDFFRSLGESMPDQTMLLLARHGKTCVAGAFVMKSADTLYGRHWGCSEQFPYLHFELCYYQTIEYCILNGLHKVDAGVQGEHKLSRGFQPVTAISHHWIGHPAFRVAVNEYLERERAEMRWYVDKLAEHLPFRTG